MPIVLPAGDDYYYTEEYKTIIRSCKEELLKVANYSPFVEDGIKFAYRYNFHKFLRNLRSSNNSPTAIAEQFIWTISFINGIEDATQDFSHLQGIYTVTQAQIDMMIQTTRTRRQ